MINDTYFLWEKEEYSYPVKGRFIPNIVTYIHEKNNKLRPAMLVVPGGGYCVVSDTEAEIVAKEFYNKGYNAFVVTYTTNLLMTIPLKLQPLKDLSKAVMFVRKKAEKFFVNPNKVIICGFSAGGHLTGSLAVHFDARELVLDSEYEGVSSRPDAVILSYPVITSGEYAHKGSFRALLGENASSKELEYMSLEKQVNKDTPPTFLWQTATDDVVPVENSYLYAKACKKYGVTFEYHVFGNGGHGMSLANEDWAAGNFGGDYTMQQYYENIQFMIDNNMELPTPFNMMGEIPKGVCARDIVKEEIKKILSQRQLQPDKGIAVWPELANNWLKKVLSI
ncbi:alpha/beta hydrolase [Clostridium estertheticum]|uniref:alpha/beta hydrolase n=1 Tax=Clostridium estertheticum TaxID=238834 RepID=UPI001CF0DABC|nr:alpha/beta hydrolase [Clostridium estertheticum]MCB2354573.1 alpha/beta hydrolase [Clostridium estertheticum]MCB2358500.1 alpha/beta hydrolase [Clostridium estertheticum]WAG40822.1 alpha/beta hydrolase [Clostridium estertheticum]